MKIDLPDHVHDNIVVLVSNLLDTADVEDFESRREFLGYVVELNEMLDYIA